MPVKIRLQRHGKKGKPFYHIVAADSRNRRDGRFIEKIGTFNPMTQPSTIDLNLDRALYWVETGAVPSDTAKRLLSEKGVLMRHHLNRGVVKGAFSQDQADKKYEDWLKNKEGKLDKVVGEIMSAKEEELKKKFEAESEVRKAREKVLLEKQAQAAGVTEEAQAEVATEELTAEAPAQEDTEKKENSSDQ